MWLLIADNGSGSASELAVIITAIVGLSGAVLGWVKFFYERRKSRESEKGPEENRTKRSSSHE
jgi:uncharacterized membrane protein YuzA (DUF378 family)